MEIALDTTITGVTVYPDRAQVTRTGEARIEAPGEHLLRIGGLALGIQRDSLRATGRGPAGTRILGVEQEMERHPAAPEETLRRLREEVERLERAVILLDERVHTIEEQQGWLRQLGEASARSIAWGLSRGTAKPEDAGNFFTYASEEAQRLAAAKLEMARQRNDAQRELDARRREYNQLGGGRFPDRLSASVRLEVATPGAVTIELSYLIAGASWYPRYDARVETATGKVRLVQQALVSQKTGEEWPQVALALSTARPAAAVRLPDDPDPWYLDVFKPIPVQSAPAPQVLGVRAMRAPPRAAGAAGDADDTFGGMARGPEVSMAMTDAVPVEMQVSAAQMDRAGAAQHFRLPGRVDIPTDGSPHMVGIGDYELPARLDYVAEPVVAEGAHLRALAINAAGRVLLPGELHIFHAGAVGDEYVGQTQLELTAENAELPLYLGVDDNVTVKRELIERETDKGSLLQRGIRRVTFGYRVTLDNRTPDRQRVILKDRLPVPRNERVKLSVLDIRPQPTTRTRLEQLTWELDLAPNEERRIEWHFVVEAPSDAQVIGLP